MLTLPLRGRAVARPPKRRRAALFLSVIATLCAVGGVTGAGASAGATVTLGETSAMPAPSCPGNPCQAVGKVTGFQLADGQMRNPYVVPADGTIQSWTVSLSRPSDSQVSFFNGFFGARPEARLAILRAAGGGSSYVLRRQSAVEALAPYLGQTAEFSTSLKVSRGDIVAITVPTWAPIFAQNIGAGNVWRASRRSGACDDTADIRRGRPQQRIGSAATYGCDYSTARLLYTATLAEEGDHRRPRPKLTVKPFQMYVAGSSDGHRVQLHKITVLGVRRGDEVSLKCLHCAGGPSHARRRASSGRLVFPTRLKVGGAARMQVSVSARNGSKRVKLYGFRVSDGETRLKGQRCFAGGSPIACKASG